MESKQYDTLRMALKLAHPTLHHTVDIISHHEYHFLLMIGHYKTHMITHLDGPETHQLAQQSAHQIASNKWGKSISLPIRHLVSSCDGLSYCQMEFNNMTPLRMAPSVSPSNIQSYCLYNWTIMSPISC